MHTAHGPTHPGQNAPVVVVADGDVLVEAALGERRLHVQIVPGLPPVVDPVDLLPLVRRLAVVELRGGGGGEREWKMGSEWGRHHHRPPTNQPTAPAHLADHDDARLLAVDRGLEEGRRLQIVFGWMGGDV